MKYQIISTGNVILADQAFVDAVYPNDYMQLPDDPTPPPPVPQSVSIREACQALEEAGMLDDIEAAIAAAPRTVQIDWQRATSVDRNWPTLLAIQSAMGLTDEQIDALFIRASQL
jgi:hypothetical protein